MRNRHNDTMALKGFTAVLAIMFAFSLALISQTDAVLAEDNSLNIYNWSDYIDESIISDFEQETGIKVTYDVFDSNEVLETKLLAGNTGYDIVVPSGAFLKRQIQAGVFQKLDKSKLPNLKNMWDLVSERTALFDPDNDYSINYMWGTTGIGYNVKAIEEKIGDQPIDSWDVLFNPDLASKISECGIHFVDDMTEIFPIALLELGKEPTSKDKKDLKEAEDLLIKARPFVQKFHSSEFINALASGDICLAIGYSGDIFQARDRAAEAENGVEINYVIPKEGAQMWFDQMAIPADAKHVENAHIFLNYIMRPDVIAKASNYVVYANGNLASQAYLDEELLNDKAVYPDEETMKRLFPQSLYPPKIQRIVTRAWTRIKTGH